MSLVLSPAATDGCAPVTANLGQMARVLHLSRKGMSDLLRRCPDLPVLRRGSAGIQWSFDPAAVIEFIQRLRATPNPTPSPPDQLALFARLPRRSTRRRTTRDRIAELALLRLERMEVEASALLVVRADVSCLLFEQLASWDCHASQILRDFEENGLPVAAIATMRASWAQADDALRRDLGWLLCDPGPASRSNAQKCS